MISIEKYNLKDKEALFILIEELQDYLAKIDPLKRLRRRPGYGKKCIENLLKKIKKQNGAIFLAKEKDIPLGFIAGIIEKQDKDELLGTVPSKPGFILELIVSAKYRRKNVGSLLMKKIEEYFHEQGCDVVLVEVFKPNKLAYDFYKKLGYIDRSTEMIKKM